MSMLDAHIPQLVAWQVQWNQAMEQLVLSYRAMAGTHENNTTSMLARDQAEGAKWGG